MEKRILRIAIDGPSGAGKSYLADRIAEKYALIHLDTGALYRAVGLYVCRKGIATEDTEAIIASLPEITLTLGFGEKGQDTILNGENVNGFIRTPQISTYASVVSAIPAVRAFLLDTQRKIAQTTPVVLDGRDIGTVILPHADVKIYLIAADEARASRRYAELCEKGVDTTYEKVLAELRERDARDSGRAVAPSKPAADAVTLDNSKLNREETVAAAIRIIEEKIR